MKKLLIMFFFVAFLFGCMTTASYQRASAGKIGCLPDEIQISNLKKHTWLATCKGKNFVCSFTDVGNYQSELSCTPEMK